MEESEKRRDRLRAMRAEADSSINAVIPAMLVSNLTNPLSETQSQEAPHSAPRFDFYTDPMAAFSGNRRRNVQSDQGYAGHFAPPVNRFPPPPPPPGTRNPEASPRAHHFHGNYSPNQQIYQGRGFGHTPFPQRGPLGMNRPPNTDPSFAPSGAEVGYNCNSQFPGPRNPSPRFTPQSGSGYRGGGRFHGSGSNPNSGRRGGRGGHFSTADRTSGDARFYNDSMIEDPWKFLEPVMWKEVEIPKPWNPRSLGTKKAKVSDDINKAGSQPSLAEYLAASFDEATGE